jgi:hypothetical protein
MRMVSLHAGRQFALDGFLRHQPDGPTGAAFGRIGANQGDDPLLLAGVEHSRRTRALFLIQRGFQSALLVAASQVAYGLSRQVNHAGNPRRADAFGQVQQRQGA